MAKPRIFISSTFYDLRQIRVELDKFIESLGYEPVRNEEGDIPYGKDEELQEYCYKEIENIDILVSIIGGRFGSKANGEERGAGYSISQKELKTAIQNNKQVFIFIDKKVATEYETYVLNKSLSAVTYKYVDNPSIYKFIEEVKNLHNNNNIKDFETADDIIRYLREQLAGLFKQYIINNERQQEQLVLRDISDTAKVLRELVEYLKDDNVENKEEILKITRVNHPIVAALRKALSISYNIYVEGESDINALFTAYGYRRENPFDYVWKRNTEKEVITITIANEIFDEGGRVQDIKPSQWKESFVQRSVESKESSDLPF